MGIRGYSAAAVAGAGIYSAARGVNQFNQGGIQDQAKGAGEVALGAGMGIGALRIAFGGGKSLSNAQMARRAAGKIERGGSIFSGATKMFAGATLAGAGYTAYEYNQGNYGRAALGAAGTTLGVGSTMGAFSAMRNSRMVSGGIRSGLEAADKALTSSRRLFDRADTFRRPRNFGYGAMAIGGLTMTAGLQQGSNSMMMMGAGITAMGGLVGAIGRSGVKYNTKKANRLTSSARYLESDAARLGSFALQGGRLTGGNPGRTTRRAAASLGKDAEKAVAESVTLLRRSTGPVRYAGYGALGIAAAGFGAAAYLGHSIGIF